jgi:hypothetical protein
MENSSTSCTLLIGFHFSRALFLFRYLRFCQNAIEGPHSRYGLDFFPFVEKKIADHVQLKHLQQLLKDALIAYQQCEKKKGRIFTGLPRYRVSEQVERGI